MLFCHSNKEVSLFKTFEIIPKNNIGQANWFFILVINFSFYILFIVRYDRLSLMMIV